MIVSRIYVYVGVENNNVKVEYTSGFKNLFNANKEDARSVLMLPINSQRQAVLKVEKILRADPDKNLVIILVDDFNRINVKELSR